MPGGKLIYTEAPEMFMLWIKIAALTGVLIASPYIMLQVWLFIAPGPVREGEEARDSVRAVVVGAVHRRRGVLALLRVPGGVEFLRGLLATSTSSSLPRVDPVFGMYVKLMLGIGLTFQLPVLMFVLARLGIVTAGFLLRNFKYAVLLIFIFAAVITPDGNPVTQLMVGGPMVVLYLFGIAAAWLFGKSKKSDPDDE